MRVGEALEPRHRTLRLLGEREHALRRHIVNDVELVVHLGDHALVGRTGIDVGEIFRTRLAVGPKRRALPILPSLPDVPASVGVVVVQDVSAERDRLVEVELQRILDLLEHVLRHDPDRVPAHREEGMEARVGFLQLEADGVGVRSLDRLHIEAEGGAPAHVLVLDLRRDRVDDICCRELDAVAPVDAAPELDGHLREVAVVGRLFGRQRVLPHAIEPAIGIDVPERIECRLLQPVRLAARIDRPNVEPAGVLDGAFGVLEDQRFVARQVGKKPLSRRVAKRHGQPNGAEQDCSQAGDYAPHLVVLLEAPETDARFGSSNATPACAAATNQI